MDDDFAIGLGRELGAPFLEFGAQLAEIFDDAVVDDRDAIGRMWMRVIFVGPAMSGPARVADADTSGKGILAQPLFKIFQLAFSASPLEFVSFKRCDARRIVATIFQAFQRIDQLLRNGATSQYPDYSTHAVNIPPKISPKLVFLLTGIPVQEVLNNYCRLRQ